MKLSQFRGMSEKVAHGRRGEGIAAETTNTSFDRGALTKAKVRPVVIGYTDLKSNVIGSVGSLQGMFYSHQADAWFGFGTLVRRGVDSLLAPQDIYRRIYFADTTGPRFMTGDQYTNNAVNLGPTTYRLGIPDPALAPVASLVSEDIPGGTNPDDIVYQRVFYVFTLVDVYGHEGPPSLASNGVSVPVEYDFEVSLTIDHAGSDINGRAFGSGARKRIYRSTSGTGGAAYQLVGETAFSTTTVVDTVPYGQEAEVLPTDTWHEPPAQIKEIDAIASNFLAGFFDNMLCFSEVKLPHAWPFEYRFPIRYKIVAIQSTANGLFVGTTGKPYWAFGADPQAAIPQEMDYDFPCVDRNSVADVNGVVVYASHDGLVAVDGSRAELLTTDLWDTEQWKELSSGGVAGFAYEGKYIFTPSPDNRTFILTLGDPTALVILDSNNSDIQDGFTDVISHARDMRHDRTVVITGDAQARMVDLTNAMVGPAKWTSDIFQTNRRLFTTARVKSSKYPVQIQLVNLDYDQSSAESVVIVVHNENPVKLPPFPPASQMIVDINLNNMPDDGHVLEVDIVSDVSELKNG